MQDLEHGGNIWEAAQKLNTSPENILDFSASLNPLGPPPWLNQVLLQTLSSSLAYPDPNYTLLREQAAKYYGVKPENIFPLNGSSELFPFLGPLIDLKDALILQPSYLEYKLWATRHKLNLKEIFLSPANNFTYPWAEIEKVLAQKPHLVFLAHPNNPTGSLLSQVKLKELVHKFPKSFFIVDMAFWDFLESKHKYLPFIAPNLLFLYSLTKILSTPGIRIGFALSSTEFISALQQNLPTWSVSTLAQELALAYFKHPLWIEKTRKTLEELKTTFLSQLQEFSWQIHSTPANFLLLSTPRAQEFRQYLFQNRVLVRKGDNFPGLGPDFLRIAIRPLKEQQRFLDLARHFFKKSRSFSPSTNKARALMVQGTASNAGKSLLVAALGRLLARRGIRVAPFKAQNMALNSFVTQEGLEMGRAQVLQAQACFLEPKAIMNPILLKPSSETGAQVIVRGKPLGNFSVEEYIAYKPKAFEVVKECFQQLQKDYDLVLIEGAGSPVEINLKEHDIVNMKMALYASAPVLLVGDINLGGIFASFVGTYSLLSPEEQKTILGFVINKFRGDKSLLQPGLATLHQITRKPTLGIIPYFDFNLPEEDSVSFKAQSNASGSKELRIGILDLPHISNFTDFTPLKEEPDVQLLIIRTPEEIKELDALILPGSKNVFTDLNYLKTKGFATKILEFQTQMEIVGICGGYQMLGLEIEDRYFLEGKGSIKGLGLLPLKSSLSLQKELTQSKATYLPQPLTVQGYEIHHGQTTPVKKLIPLFQDSKQKILGYKHLSLNIWGTYLHGLFDNDGFRHFWLNRLRKAKGLGPLNNRPSFDLNWKLDKLADLVEKNMDLDYILKHLGY